MFLLLLAGPSGPPVLGIGLRLGHSVPDPEVERLVVAHDLPIVLRHVELLAVHEQGGVVGLEGGEHAGDVGNLDVL